MTLPHFSLPSRPRGPLAVLAIVTCLSVVRTADASAVSCEFPDCNGDGAINSCDLVICESDMETWNLRSDVNGDGMVDTTDLQCVVDACRMTPLPSGLSGAATIGVYFDPQGTVSQLDGVAPGTVVDIWVVAHDLPAPNSIGGYNFALELGGQPATLAEVAPASLAGSVQLPGNNAAAGACSRGGDGFCLPDDDAVVLMHYRFSYAGTDPTIIGVRGLRDPYQGPWPAPAYVSCGYCNWTYFQLAAPFRGQAIINPPPINCENGDLNEDGVVDICDNALMESDYRTGNLRSDFDGNHVVDVCDLHDFAWCWAQGTLPHGAMGPATIGVYFDEAGTVSELTVASVPATVDLYVVVHGLPAATGIAAYTFALDLGVGIPGVTEVLPPSLAGSYGLAGNLDIVGACARGGDGFCLDRADAVVLMHYQLSYFGVANAVIGLQGLTNVMGTWPHPAYDACGGTCSWTYLDVPPDKRGRAVINPIDFNGNGIGDVFETYGQRWYHITGASTGSAWSLALRKADASGTHYVSAQSALPDGAPASEFAKRIANWIEPIGGYGAGPEASVLPWSSSSFAVSFPDGDDYDLGVGPEGAVYEDGYCWIPPDRTCSFNPMIAAIAEPLSAVPEAPAFSLENHPNPFNPSTTIAFELPAAAEVDLQVFDARGRHVRTLLAHAPVSAGRHEATWDGHDDRGRQVAAGVYVYRLQAGGVATARRTALIK
jgi:hypothetical protein